MNPNGKKENLTKAGSGPGRPKGSKNKIPYDLKEKVVQIAQDLEKKKKGLQHVAEQEPKWFYENFVKALLPKAVSGDFNVTVTATHQDIEKMTDEELAEELKRLDHR